MTTIFKLGLLESGDPPSVEVKVIAGEAHVIVGEEVEIMRSDAMCQYTACARRVAPGLHKARLKYCPAHITYAKENTRARYLQQKTITEQQGTCFKSGCNEQRAVSRKRPDLKGRFCEAHAEHIRQQRRARSQTQA